MRTKARAAVLAAFVALAMGVGGGALAQTDDCVEPLLDLPALNACTDAEGRVIMDLPALNLRSEPNFFGEPEAAPEPSGPLPKTGVNVGDVAAIGLAALGMGGVLVRRLRFSATV